VVVQGLVGEPGTRTLLGGFRWLRLRETYTIATSSPFIPPSPVDIRNTTDKFDAFNNLWALQIGTRSAQQLKDRQGGGERDGGGPHGFDPKATVRVTPFPSWIVIAASAATPGRRSVLPFGHATSMPSIFDRAPRPNVNGSSLCDR